MDVQCQGEQIPPLVILHPTVAHRISKVYWNYITNTHFVFALPSQYTLFKLKTKHHSVRCSLFFCLPNFALQCYWSTCQLLLVTKQVPWPEFWNWVEPILGRQHLNSGLHRRHNVHNPKLIAAPLANQMNGDTIAYALHCTGAVHIAMCNSPRTNSATSHH